MKKHVPQETARKTIVLFQADNIGPYSLSPIRANKSSGRISSCNFLSTQSIYSSPFLNPYVVLLSLKRQILIIINAIFFS